MLAAEDPSVSAEKDTAATGTKSDKTNDSERWTTASTGVRTTAQWLATTLGTIAGVAFGAGPLINNETDVSKWDASRWFWVLAAAAVGVLGIVAIVSRLVVAMLPVEVALDGLPKGLRDRIKADADAYLPGDARTLTDFRDRLVAYSRAAAGLEIQARREADPEQKKLLEDRAKIQAENRDRYQAKRAEMFAQAKYHIEAGRLGGRGNAIWFSLAAIAAVIGISCFTFLTHVPAGDGDDTPSPQGALLIFKTGSEELWSTLDLDACAAPGERNEVPVLLLGTSGENDDHYKVQTLGQPAGCGRYSFTVSDEIVDIVVPKPIEVTLKEPSPTSVTTSPSAPNP